jgi:hypothetical protein
MVKNLFVVCSQKENYFQLFDKLTLKSGEPIQVDQAPWADIEVRVIAAQIYVEGIRSRGMRGLWRGDVERVGCSGSSNEIFSFRWFHTATRRDAW